MPRTSLAVAALLLLAATCAAGDPPSGAEVIDFEALPTGTIVSEVFGSGGSGPIGVRGTNPSFPDGINAAVIFDSAAPTGLTGVDTDLGTPNQDFGGPGIGAGGEAGSPFENDTALGKILIIEENLVDDDGDGLVDSPDDADQVNAVQLFDFSEIGGATLHAITLIDVENDRNAAVVAFLDAGGEPVGPAVALPQVGNNGVATVDLGDVAGVWQMVVVLGGSGGIDNVVFSGDECTGSIGDCIWEDVNCNGLQDPGEPGIPGVPVQLYDDMGALIARAGTDADGKYEFRGLCAGDYQVVVREGLALAGFERTLCEVGDDPAVDSNCSPAQVTLPEDDSRDDTIDFGYKRICAGEIGDFVWEDVDCDGLQDEGEPGIEGVTIKLLDGSGAVIETTVTDENGEYRFGGLCAGTYTVMVQDGTLPDDFEPTLCNVGDDDEIDNDCSPATVVLDDDETVDLSVDFGFKRVFEGEGCTPGYWKQSHHFDSWPEPYEPSTPFGDVFDDAFPGMSLVEVAGQGGGQLNALGRHTVAALLNAASDHVAYGMTAQGVIDAFNDVYPGGDYEDLKDHFEDLNEQGCPLN